MINGESIRPIEYFAMFLCFCGVTAIALSKGSDPQLSTDQQITAYGIFLTILMSWLYSLTNVCNRKIKGVYFAIVTFWHSVTGVVFGLVYLAGMYIFLGRGMILHADKSVYWWLFACCCLDFVGVNCQNIAF